MRKPGSAILRLVVCLGAALGAALVTPPPQAARASALPEALSGPMDVLYADPANLMYRYGPTEVERASAAQSSAPTANISVTYSGFSAEAQAAFQAAVDVWSNVIVSAVPIRVSASFTPLGTGILGSAGPTVVCTSSGGVANTYYAAALADKLRGTSFCAALVGSGFEIQANFNSAFTAWEYGTSGTPVSGKYSFMTVVLHELGHGLGFYGSMSASGGIGSFRSAAPDIYDRFAVTGAGAALLSFANSSPALGTQLVSDDTYFNGSNANSNNGGTRPKLESHFFTNAGNDNGFLQGSSYSHVDDALYSGTANGLMTWALAAAELYSDPGPIVKGIFKDEGWELAGAPVPDPRMSLDSPSNGSRVGLTFTASGWALDRGGTSGTGVDAVHVYAVAITNGVVGGGIGQFVCAGTYGSARGDLGAIFGSRFTNVGYSCAGTLAAGVYRVTAYAHSTVSGTFNNSASADVTVGQVSDPRMSLDGPANGSTIQQPFNTGGWAVDRGALSGTGVDAIHVWAFPVVNGVIGAGQFVNAALLGGARPDVGAVFGSQFNNSGFNFLMTGLAAGQYYVGVYVHSSVTGTFNQQQFALVTIR